MYESVIESLNMIIKNLEENKLYCINVIENKVEGFYPLDIDGTKMLITHFEKNIAEHKEAIIALQMVENGKMRVI